MSKTVALKKAVRDIISTIPKEARYAQVQGAAIIGLHVSQKDGVLTPSVMFWAQVKPEIAIMMCEEVIRELRERIAKTAPPVEIKAPLPAGSQEVLQ